MEENCGWFGCGKEKDLLQLEKRGGVWWQSPDLREMRATPGVTPPPHFFRTIFHDSCVMTL